MIIRWEDRGSAEVALTGTPQATIGTGESDGRRRWVNGNYSSRGQCATRSRRLGEVCRPGSVTGTPASGFDWVAPQSGSRHPLKVDAHACEARTGFGKLPVQLSRVVTSGPRWRSHRGAARVFTTSAHRSTYEFCCATPCLTGPKIGRSLDLGKVPGGEDHSHDEVLDRDPR